MKLRAKKGARQTLLLTLFLVLCVHITKASIQEFYRWPQNAIASLAESGDIKGKDHNNDADPSRRQNLLSSLILSQKVLSPKKELGI